MRSILTPTVTRANLCIHLARPRRAWKRSLFLNLRLRRHEKVLGADHSSTKASAGVTADFLGCPQVR